MMKMFIEPHGSPRKVDLNKDSTFVTPDLSFANGLRPNFKFKGTPELF